MCNKKKYMPDFTARYSTIAGRNGLSFTVLSSGKVILKCPENECFDFVKDVGVFETSVNLSKLKKLEHILSSQAFHSIRMPEGVIPGEVVRTIEWQSGCSEPLIRFACESKQTHQLFQDVESEFKKLISYVAKFPVISIHNQTILSSTQFNTYDTITVKLVFTNTGKDDLIIPNLFDFETMLEFSGIRIDIPLESRTGNHQFFHTITRAAILENSAQENSNGKIVVKSDENFIVNMSWVPLLTSGIYAFKCSFTSKIFNEKDNEILPFCLQSDVLSFKVN
jgi:hypothetical protein